VLSAAAGCTDMSYEQIRLGMTQRECERALPGSSPWRTELGLCWRQDDALGRRDAMVILLGQDQRVAGKLQATSYPRGRPMGPERGFRLRGELDPKGSGLDATGPLDALRAIASDLTGYRGAKPALEAHAWVAAGLVRLLERWPRVGSEAAQFPGLSEALDRIPGGGRAEIRVDNRGLYSFEYCQPAVP
jgi:hypothetical protein